MVIEGRRYAGRKNP
jgi:hypothetical protein